MPTVRPVITQSDWDAFRAVPQEVYREDPNWIPDETIDLDELLVNRSPIARDRAEIQAFVAYEDLRPVGRIVAIADDRYNKHHDERAAFFGFYEATASDEVSFGLLDAVAQWARDRSLAQLYGPVSLSMLFGAGMLVDGCDRPALVGMPYNPVYYADQVTRWGMSKVKDLHSFQMPIPRRRLPRKERAARRGLVPAGLSLRAMNPQRFDDEVETIRQIYNAAFGDFWGFTPVEPDEFHALAHGFRPVMDTDLVVFAEVDGVPAGYLMAFPDVNQALVKAARRHSALGRNLTMLWHLQGPARRWTVRHARVDMLAVHPSYQDRWVAGLLIVEVLRRIYRKGYTSAEAAPILEDASWPRSIRKALTLDRVYRVYGRTLIADA